MDITKYRPWEDKTRINWAVENLTSLRAAKVPNTHLKHLILPPLQIHLSINSSAFESSLI